MNKNINNVVELTEKELEGVVGGCGRVDLRVWDGLRRLHADPPVIPLVDEYKPIMDLVVKKVRLR